MDKRVVVARFGKSSGFVGKAIELIITLNSPRARLVLD